MRSVNIRRCSAWAAALLLAGSVTTAALAASQPLTERPGEALALTILLKSNPGRP